MVGSPANCNKWALVTAGISLAQFPAWNPAVSSDCVTI